ncbi:MAG: mechanosensitive ion channel [Hydromonas sp.]|nr:mechanosensitive ion channel [Hydromonas sp.]
MTTLEHTLTSKNAPVQGVHALIAEISPTSMAITLLIIALGFFVTWMVRRIYRQRDLQHKVPNWMNVLMRMTLPFLLWLFAHITMQIYANKGLTTIWFEFMAQLFAAWFFVRLFLYVVRRALPEGARRATLERLSIVVIWALMLLDYVGKLDGIFARLDGFKIKLGNAQLSVLDGLTLVAVVLVLWLVVQWLTHEIEDLLLKKPNQKFASFDLSARMVLVRFLKGLLILIAILLSLSASGIDLTVLSVFGGALGVGIGLGLQKIASNYVSGFVMLFERSVRIGDLISTSDGTRGFVRTINARYTLIEGASGDEVLVPNENLIVNPVVNWTLHDKKNWLSTQLPVNYDIDLDFIMPKIIQAVKDLPRVAQSPTPNVLLSSISDKGYILEITWWLLDPENGRMNIISEVNLVAWRVLREHNVGIFTLKAASVVRVEHSDDADMVGVP